MSFRQTRWRFLAVSLAALILLGNNYSFDNPQALQTQIQQQLGINIIQFNLLYSVFALPNIFLTILGGMIIDRLGVRFGIFTFTLIVTIGQLIIALGGKFNEYSLMLLGRAVFGVASENLIIAQSTFVSLWFKGTELATAMGIIMTIPELGGALNSLLTPLIYESSQSLSVPLFTSVGFCLFSFACGIILVQLDKYADKYDQRQSDCQYVLEQKMMKDDEGEEDEDEEEKEKLEESKEEISLKDLKQLSGTVWILLMICTFSLCIFIPFLDNANQFCQQRFNLSNISAGRAIIITYLTPMFVSPFIGCIVDKVGYRRRWMILTSLLFIISHLLFAIIPTPEDGSPQFAAVVPLFLLGVSYAFYSCVMIPCVQYLVEQRIMGTAFGLMGLFESIGACVFPLVSSQIYNTNGDYRQVGFFYMGIGCVNLIFVLTLYFVDKKGSEVLDRINPLEGKGDGKSSSSTSDDDSVASDLTDEDEREYFEMKENINSFKLQPLETNSDSKSEPGDFKMQRSLSFEYSMQITKLDNQ
ncbi:unnamed protein product [Paramecium sonneborni]|uniref:Major facilitator superfamily (MFS) profile domain-containing protein n=1 Tax=Paramecium sonneborni TaxID=65129 RepID=A0A8S1QJM3_9CILI|nr:unnamed protein product [Paramecium sonneborni]